MQKPLPDSMKSFTQYKNKQDVLSKINGAALFVLSSDYEGMPNALIEALSLGLPCISTDCPCGGSKYLINNEVNGILIKVKDEDALVQSVRRVLSDERFAERLGKNAREIKDKLRADIIAEKYLNFIKGWV